VTWRALRAKTARGPGPPTGSRTPVYYPDPSPGREQTPRQGGPGSPRVPGHRHAHGHQASSERLAHLPHSMREMISVLCRSRARRDFCQAVLLIARYQGTQYSCWCHPRQSTTPVRHDCSATEYHNAYAVDPTIYAATYTASTGVSPMGQVRTPLGQKVYSAKKCIQEEMLNHCNTVRVYFWYSIHPRWAHLSGPNTCVHASLAL